ncbi:flagellar basal-body rod protein FlgB [Alkalilimnicola ehrlichii]|uniref:Flagellar basal body rod protein FlgB n=1 Tax=Alkalilimnicola ehrlichii TaxID=351052 RepID=A0A3E0WUT8_9GAMM|nr:flagellar basal body rod protein FlgB [Alkalilimnicola ehrlichii]RFA28564.1 flagellar basal-body rod protein FlgB [Alkalilimnicola ehrlichii]RFA35727.1 flagellar basal-body rod protein FlgB [Alkalilimnicola ehrlichii]
MSISFDKALGAHPAALNLRSERAKVLAENLANADTPHFKARDFDFQAAMQQATAGQKMAPLQTTNERHLQPANFSAGRAEMLYRVPYGPALDGNTVEMHAEQSKFAENSVHYQASLTFLGDRIQGLVGALRGE